ncbi:RNA polymerase sigma factor [Hephaestia mangrovi]|uniref:RNA polymerase sigma factor n=1 Tax=Hephaestia mangrovi TaxID=2873268 RepID=UPI001CA64460|nr:RNA polymerase sigma factor [Hephaestia mangrovi]MBY8829153.1 RNA polymerase sigma factor [Hephaestia mangrovi]
MHKDRNADVTNETGRLWQELDRRYRSVLFGYFLKRVYDRGEAEDLTQEVFARLTRHPDKPQGKAADAYIFVIASNLLKDRARAQVSRRASAHRSWENAFENAINTPSLVEDRHPERVLIGRETLDQVLLALGELSERTRDVFILSRLENMRHRDIAALHGISVSAVEKHVMKGMAHLGARFLRP